MQSGLCFRCCPNGRAVGPGVSFCNHTPGRWPGLGKRMGRWPAKFHPSSFILHPSSFILHPSSFILHPSSFILHPSSFILHSSFVIRHSSFPSLTVPRRRCQCLSSCSGKSLRWWTPRDSSRHRAVAVMTRATVSMFCSSQPSGSVN